MQTFLLVLLGITAAFLFTLKSLLLPLFYGVVFAGVLYPLYGRIKTGFRGKETVSVVVTIFIGVIVLVIVFSVLGAFIARDAAILVASARDKVDSLAPNVELLFQSLRNFLPDAFSDRLSDVNFREQIINVVQNLGQRIFDSIGGLAGSTVRILGLSLVTFYATFYFLKNGRVWLSHLSRIFPLPTAEEKFLGEKFIVMVRTSLKMVFVMGAVQGFLGGLIFGLLGLGTPFFWGLIFALLSLIPGLGHYIIWIPAALILILTGGMAKAIILIVYGLVVLALSDDLLRPYLVGRSVQIHPFLVFLATLGGLATFGFTGLILGPVLASLTLAVWELYEKRYSEASRY